MSSIPARLMTFVILVGVATFAEAQTKAPTAPTDKKQSDGDAAAEREKIWNSADMLRARAWLSDYCSKSAKVTPEESQRYQQELANMSPTQMKLWLLKFDEEEQMRQQQYAAFQQQNAAGLQHAAAIHQQMKQAYANINQAENRSADLAQQNITEEREQAQSNEENKQEEQALPPAVPYGFYGGYGPIGYGGYGGGVQYHYHQY